MKNVEEDAITGDNVIKIFTMVDEEVIPIEQHSTEMVEEDAIAGDNAIEIFAIVGELVIRINQHLTNAAETFAFEGEAMPVKKHSTNMVEDAINAIEKDTFTGDYIVENATHFNEEAE